MWKNGPRDPNMKNLEKTRLASSSRYSWIHEGGPEDIRVQAIFLGPKGVLVHKSKLRFEDISSVQVITFFLGL